MEGRGHGDMGCGSVAVMEGICRTSLLVASIFLVKKVIG